MVLVEDEAIEASEPPFLASGWWLGRGLLNPISL